MGLHASTGGVTRKVNSAVRSTTIDNETVSGSAATRNNAPAAVFQLLCEARGALVLQIFHDLRDGARAEIALGAMADADGASFRFLRADD